MNTPASAFIPSRKATQEEIDHVEKLFCDNVLGARDYANLEIENRTLLAEVERLTDWQDRHTECVANLRTTVAQLEREVCVPGSWRCAKCSLVIQKSVLHVGDGALVSSDNTPDNCPNCNVPMWRMSERDERKEAQRSFSDLFDKYQQLERTVADQAAALAERDKDAERYRWLSSMWWQNRLPHEIIVACSRDLTIAIDAALAASVSTQEKPK